MEPEKLLQLLSKMDLLLAKMAAKSTGNTSLYYPMMLKPGTFYIPSPPTPGDADTKPNIDNTMTSSMTSPGVTESKVLPVLPGHCNKVLQRLASGLPIDQSDMVNESWKPTQSTNQNQDGALAIVNDDIEVQAELRIHKWLATK